MIITDESKLRVVSEPATLEEVASIVSQLEIELNQSNLEGKPGIGLAAPQIGIYKKVAIIRVGRDSINLVNAKITDKKEFCLFNKEGCLSFPNRVQDTFRFNEITVENEVYPFKFVATGLTAICIQHELDHLEGKLFIDYIATPTKSKQKPNDKCACFSGLKFKKCCGK